jgi:poly(A) polymerase
VEVATFRAASDGQTEGLAEDREHSESGRILRDNVYGSIDDDIWRRDFTVNALYYNIADFSVWDYTGGIEDVRTRTLRLIDDPWTRYREDPVRMLRAARFAAKLDFTIASESAAPIHDLGPLLLDVPPARLFDETLKLFQTGHAVKSFDKLVEYDLLRYLFPGAAALLETDQAETVAEFIRCGLANTDKRIAEDMSVTPMFLYAVLLWPPIQALADRLRAEQGRSEFEVMQEAMFRVVHEQTARTALPKRFSVPMKEVLALQRRFENRKGVRAERLLEHKRFRAAYDFLVLRSQCGEVEPELAEWWTEIQAADADRRREAFGVGGGKSGAKRRRRPRRRSRKDRPEGS